MINKRYQVFISSTYLDLHEERQELIRALLELDCIPAGMELFPASDDDAWTLIKRVIDESDYYLVISAGRYGSEHPETGVGYTEMEYDYAVETGKPIIGFLHHDLSALPVGKSEADAGKIGKRDAFRAKLQSRVTKEFTSPDVLAGGASRAVVQLIRQRPGLGWVRANQARDPAVEGELKELKLKLAAREQEVERLRTEVNARRGEASDHVEVEGLEAVSRYLNRVSPGVIIEDCISSILGPLIRNRDQGVSYLRVGQAAELVSNSTGLSQNLIEDVIFLLAEADLIRVDADDDLIFNAQLTDLMRRLRVVAVMNTRKQA